MDFTANQMILLLQIYRGTENEGFRIGTYEHDLAFLQTEGFIKRTRDRNFVTTLADAWIRNHLLKGPQ